jgi:hypothetical protein
MCVCVCVCEGVCEVVCVRAGGRAGGACVLYTRGAARVCVADGVGCGCRAQGVGASPVCRTLPPPDRRALSMYDPSTSAERRGGMAAGTLKGKAALAAAAGAGAAAAAAAAAGGGAGGASAAAAAAAASKDTENRAPPSHVTGVKRKVPVAPPAAPTRIVRPRAGATAGHV